MYLLKPSDLHNNAAVPPAPPIGSEGMLKTRLGELDNSMQKILLSTTPRHEKIRLYLEVLRQYIMGARHLDRVLQQPSSGLHMIERGSQTAHEEGHPAMYDASTITIDEPSLVKRDASTSTPAAKQLYDVSTSTDVIEPAPTTTPMQARGVEPEVERPIRPSRQSFYEIAEQTTHPYNMDALLDLMPPSKKADAQRFLTEIANSTTMRWDPATGHVYRGEQRISGINSLMHKFLQKRFSTTQASKGDLAGYDDFMKAVGEARASQRPQQRQQVGEGRVVWLRY
jgi:hypothetical protein